MLHNLPDLAAEPTPARKKRRWLRWCADRDLPGHLIGMAKQVLLAIENMIADWNRKSASRASLERNVAAWLAAFGAAYAAWLAAPERA